MTGNFVKADIDKKEPTGSVFKYRVVDEDSQKVTPNKRKGERPNVLIVDESTKEHWCVSTPPGGILIGESIYELVKDSFNIETVDSIKGKAKPIQVHRVLN